MPQSRSLKPTIKVDLKDIAKLNSSTAEQRQDIDAINETDSSFKKSLGGAIYNGDDDILPIVTDKNLKLIFGYKVSTGKLIGTGIGEDQIKEFLSSEKFANFNGASGIYPLLVDSALNVLLGYDSHSQRIFGAGIESSSNPDAISTPIIEKAKNHIIAYGQSLSVGAQGEPAQSTTQPYSNLTFQGGPRAYDGSSFSWSPLKPLVEDNATAPDGLTNRGETICSGLANYATTLRAMDGKATDSHVILASSAGYGGAPIADLEKGTSWYNNTFLEHINQAHTIDTDHAVHCIAWLQGENDGSLSTPFETYLSKLNQLITDINVDAASITGQSSPVFMLTYQTCTRSAQWRQIQLAQLQAAKTNPLIFLVSPLYFLPHNADEVHLTATGYKWLGGYFGRAYKTLLDGKRPKWLNPLSATRRGSVIRVRFDVPASPMVLDTTNLGAATDHGFAVEDSGGLVSLDTVEIDGQDVMITLAESTSGAVVVRYAMDYLGSGLAINNAGSGNLRDSATETILVDSVERDLYNWAPHFELDVIDIGE